MLEKQLKEKSLYPQSLNKNVQGYLTTRYLKHSQRDLIHLRNKRLHMSLIYYSRNYARKHIIAIDIIDFDFIIISNEEKTDLGKAPDDGVYIYGLYLEGCRWDERKEALEES